MFSAKTIVEEIGTEEIFFCGLPGGKRQHKSVIDLFYWSSECVPEGK